jgi:hypothetical protein
MTVKVLEAGKMKEQKSLGWVVLVGMIMSILGILAMAKVSDHREKEMSRRIREAEDEVLMHRGEADHCWNFVKKHLTEVIRFRCPDVKE